MLRNGHRREKSHTVSNLGDGAEEERSEHGARVPARGRRRWPLASMWSTNVSGDGAPEEHGGGARARERRTGAGVTVEELGGGDGDGGAKFR